MGNLREWNAIALKLGNTAAKFLVKRPAVRQSRQGVRSGFCDVGFQRFGLVLEFGFRLGEPVLHVLVDRDKLGNRCQDGRSLEPLAMSARH